MQRFIYIVSFVVTLAMSTARAGWVDEQGNPIPDSDYRKSVGTLAAQLVITGNESQLLENWNTPSQSVELPTSNEFGVNEIITVFVVFGGCATDADGNCDLNMQITVYQPNGEVYSGLPVMEVWSGKPVPPEKRLGLSAEYIRIVVEPDEPLGKYRIDARIRDNISKQGMTLRSHFTAVEAR